MPEPQFRPAPEVEAVARDIIAKHHRHLIDCACTVLFLFRDTPEKNKGKEVIGKAYLKSGMDAYLIQQIHREYGTFQDTPQLFVICIWKEGWDYMLKSDHQKRGLVDHELSHCWAEADPETGDPILKILPHDIEEFNRIARQYGDYLPDIAAFRKALAEGCQLSFADISGLPEGAVMEMPPVPEGRKGTKGTKGSAAKAVLTISDGRESIRQAMDRQQAEGGAA